MSSTLSGSDALSDWLDLVPPRELPDLLRGVEEDILEQIRGNILALQACLRLMRRGIVRKRRIIGYGELPPEMLDIALFRCGGRRRRVRERVISPEQFALLREKLEAAVHEIAGMFIALSPVREVVFTHDEELERQRRVPLYAKQWQRIEESYDEDELLRQGPAASAVWCHELGRQFPSARQAARFCREALGKSKIKRSDIRTAIRRGCKCAGLRWSYLADVPKSIIRNGCERPVRRKCPLELRADETFASITEAAEAAGCSSSTLSDVLNGDGFYGGWKYVWDEPQTVELMPSAEQAFGEMFPLFAGV